MVDSLYSGPNVAFPPLEEPGKGVDVVEVSNIVGGIAVGEDEVSLVERKLDKFLP